MPSFDCGGGRCGEFSCASCWDDATRKEYWGLLKEGNSDREAAKIMARRLHARVHDNRSPLEAARADLARVTAERDAAVSDQNEAMALVIGLEGAVHRLTEELRVARLDASTTSLQADGYRRERDALQARLDDYYDDHRAVVAGQCAPDERHCSCVPHLRREVEAMRAVVEAARVLRDADYDDVYGTIDGTLQALDALRTRKVGE